MEFGVPNFVWGAKIIHTMEFGLCCFVWNAAWTNRTIFHCMVVSKLPMVLRDFWPKKPGPTLKGDLYVLGVNHQKENAKMLKTRERISCISLLKQQITMIHYVKCSVQMIVAESDQPQHGILQLATTHKWSQFVETLVTFEETYLCL